MYYIFNTLYGIGRKNKIKEWNISIINKSNYSVIIYSYGYLNSKKIECTKNIYDDKNNKSTSHYQLAILHAQQIWKDKIENGFSTNIEIIKKQQQHNKEIKEAREARLIKRSY